MIWIFAIVAVVLVTIIVELMLVYQKRAHELRMRQEPLRRRVRQHLREMQEATLKIRRTVVQGLEELDLGIEQMRKQSEGLTNAIGRLESEAFAQVREEVHDVEEAVAEAGEENPGAEDEEENKRETLREARRKREELDNHITSLRRDVEIARRTMNRIETKMEKRLSSAAQRAKSQ